MSTERLTVARLALSNLLEIYAPMNAGRTAALDALRAGVDELEAAVREDVARPETVTGDFAPDAPAAERANDTNPRRSRR
jgi:hypothetical protein